jgi:hypothetical protein
MSEHDQKYRDPIARKNYRKQWVKEHYNVIKGFRPICKFDALCGDLKSMITVSPSDFFFGNDKTEPLTLYGSTLVVHIPRSLLSRARIQVDKVTGKIKGTSAMQSAN